MAKKPNNNMVIESLPIIDPNLDRLDTEVLDDNSAKVEGVTDGLMDDRDLDRDGVERKHSPTSAGSAKNIKPYIPSRWALEPPLSKQNLAKKWAADIECLRSLSEDCKELREAVFEEYRLTETQKVWTPKHADSGMSSEFYGMSERAILKKLGIQLAGENGQVLIPGILTIDGPLWDMLHGVNKTCGLKRDVREDSMGFARDCPTYMPARETKK